MRVLLLLLIVTLPLAFTGNQVRAQSPTPIIVQAAGSTPVTAPAATPTPVPNDPYAYEAEMRTLREMKAANEEILRKQEATLQRLDEIQKAAEQLKVFSKRG
jgi:hypothetical protein